MTYLIGWSVLSDGFVSYLRSLWAPARTYEAPMIIGLVALLCLTNTLGVRLGSGVIGFFTVAKLIQLTLLIIASSPSRAPPGTLRWRWCHPALGTSSRRCS